MQIIFINIIVHVKFNCKKRLARLMRNRLISRFTNDAQIKVVDFLIAQYGKKDRKERNRAADRQVIKAARESKSGGI